MSQRQSLTPALALSAAAHVGALATAAVLGVSWIAGSRATVPPPPAALYVDLVQPVVATEEHVVLGARASAAAAVAATAESRGARGGIRDVARPRAPGPVHPRRPSDGLPAGEPPSEQPRALGTGLPEVPRPPAAPSPPASEEDPRPPSPGVSPPPAIPSLPTPSPPALPTTVIARAVSESPTRATVSELPRSSSPAPEGDSRPPVPLERATTVELAPVDAAPTPIPSPPAAAGKPVLGESPPRRAGPSRPAGASSDVGVAAGPSAGSRSGASTSAPPPSSDVEAGGGSARGARGTGGSTPGYSLDEGEGAPEGSTAARPRTRAASARTGPDEGSVGGGGSAAGGIPPEYEAYVRALRQRIQERIVYPWMAARRGQQGVIELEVRLGPEGRLVGVEVVGGPSAESLRTAAVSAVRGAAPFPFPPGVEGRPLIVRLPVEFRLR